MEKKKISLYNGKIVNFDLTKDNDLVIAKTMPP